MAISSAMPSSSHPAVVSPVVVGDLVGQYSAALTNRARGVVPSVYRDAVPVGGSVRALGYPLFRDRQDHHRSGQRRSHELFGVSGRLLQQAHRVACSTLLPHDDQVYSVR